MGLLVVAARRRAFAGVDGAACVLLLPFVLPRFKPYAFVLLVPFLVLALSQGRIALRRAGLVVLLASMPFLLRVDLDLIIRLSEGTAMTFLGYFPLAFTAATLVALLAKPREASETQAPARSS